MKKLSPRILFALAALVAMLAACAPSGAPSATISPIPTEQPTPLPSATQPPTPLPTDAAPAPTATASPTQQGTPAVQPQAFNDCALLPVLPNCGSKAALLLSGELVVYDQAKQRLVGIDFKTGAAWQLPQPQPDLMSFSPSGKLVGLYYPGAPSSQVETFDAASGLPQPPTVVLQGLLNWTPQDGLNTSQFRTTWSAGGDAAWIDSNTAVAHVRFAADPGKEVTWPVAPAPSDQIPQAVAWVPGTDLLLFESHFASNDMWVTGGELSTLNVKTGEVKDLKAHMKLDFQFQWHPSQPGVMALAESSSNPTMGGQRLAVLNVLTGQLKYLIEDAMVVASYPSWLPDGKTILFAVSLPPAAVQSNPIFASQGIFLINSDGSGLRAVTKPDSTAQQGDDHPQLLAGGKYFLYFRAQPGSSTLRLAALDGSLDQPITGPLPAPQCMAGPQCAWDSIAVYK